MQYAEFIAALQTTLPETIPMESLATDGRSSEIAAEEGPEAGDNSKRRGSTSSNLPASVSMGSVRASGVEPAAQQAEDR